ncbi:MAG: hypothetical protein K0Q55_3520, partial [Verrucomicrobia bacterium]|nr:hypothetical protein [Verrucomicrobiota bacterium]
MKLAPKRAASKLRRRPALKPVNPIFLERRVLILAPTGNDARLTEGFLAKQGLFTQVCSGIKELCTEVPRGCGAILLAEETLGVSSISLLVRALAQQPPWSDIPLVIITSGGEASQVQLRRLAMFGPGGSVTLVERPLRPGTLISTMEVALRGR